MSYDTKIYQFKIHIKKITPMIWRRFLIANSNTLKDLHYVIQILMGWTDYHLNEFIIQGRRYTIPNAIGNISAGGSYTKGIKLAEFCFSEKEKFLYSYDFTANWQFEVRLEKIDIPQEKKVYPVCISGSGASPEEECGGPYRFTELKNHWAIEVNGVLTDFIIALANKKNAKKRIREVFDMGKLRQAKYWSNIHQYKRKEINNFLASYSKGDDRWQEAFAEVIYL